MPPAHTRRERKERKEGYNRHWCDCAPLKSTSPRNGLDKIHCYCCIFLQIVQTIIPTIHTFVLSPQCSSTVDEMRKAKVKSVTAALIEKIFLELMRLVVKQPLNRRGLTRSMSACQLRLFKYANLWQLHKTVHHSGRTRVRMQIHLRSIRPP